MLPKYTYDLPPQVIRELCTLLDRKDGWKDLAGTYMEYTPHEINEMELTANRLKMSPTNQMLRWWGRQNHYTAELFMLLYRMKHVLALRCIAPYVEEKYHYFLKKLDGSNYRIQSAVVNHIDGFNEQRIQNRIVANQNELLNLNTGDDSQIQVIRAVSTGDSAANSDMTPSTGVIGDERVNQEILRNVSKLPMMPYEELAAATNNWCKSNLLGKGGYGKVYQGELKLSAVAVKVLNSKNDKDNKELIRELCLNQYRHENIVPLYGYSIGGPETCLVYQYMPGRSLEQRLKLSEPFAPLTWPQRRRIALGVARGLHYLHNMASRPLIHGDIKPANILLDSCSMPKIGDFGLARMGPHGQDGTQFLVSKVYGTQPYLPAEYLLSRRLSPAVDVFSYGVVAAQLATALPCDRAERPRPLANYVQYLAASGVDLAAYEDPILCKTPQSDPRMCRELLAIAAHCTAPAAERRPAMLDVYRRLEALAALPALPALPGGEGAL